MKSSVLLIEDDPQQSQTIKAAIERRYRSLEVELLETESDFYHRLASISEGGSLPSMVICDVMLPWTFPAPNAPAQPADVARGTFRKAGLRCWKAFRKRDDLRSVPWIHFTVLDEKTIDLESHSDSKTGYAQKAGSIEPLFAEIEEFRDDAWMETEDEVSRKLLISSTMRKILFDGLRVSLDECATTLP